MSQATEIGHISQPAFGMGRASSPVNGYTDKEIKQGTQACVYPLDERAQAQTEYSDGANFQKDGRAASGKWRGSRTDSYPKLFHSIASKIQPEPTERRVTQV